MAPIIASRTWEGRYNECPVCGQECWIEPSDPAGDAPCPTCGHLLWFGGPSILDRNPPEASSLRDGQPDRASLARRAGRAVARVVRAVRG